MGFYLFSATELHELLKLPILVAHFEEHRSENKELSLIDFLAEHYGGANELDQDWQKDSKLPFKTFQSDFSHVHFIEPQSAPYIPSFFSEWISSLLRAPNQDSLPDDRSNNIWHPPKDIV